MVGSTLLNQTLGDEVASAIERKVADLALEQVAKHDGVVVKDTGDGLMAAFRSARRAVTCSQELQRKMAQRNWDQSGGATQLRIGLHTGEIIAENGDLQGETVIITKRIEETAPPSSIYASETVYAVLGTIRSELEDRGDFDLKGIAVPWHLYEVPWQKKATRTVLDPNEPTPFVGREAEYRHLVGLAEKAIASSGALALIAGEAGVGKTRLIGEVAKKARDLGMLVLVGQCLDMEGAPPYQPTIEQLERTVRIVSSDNVREALGENAPEVAKLLPELRQRYPDIPDPVALPPEQERRYLLHGMCEFIERGARAQPMMLVYEDLHWADESTLQLLHHLSQRLSEIPVLAIGTYRHTEVKPGHPFAAALPNMLRQRLAEDRVLKRLTEDGVAAILEGRTGRAPPSGLVSLVYSETEGNPFFVEEMFRHLHDAGKLLDGEGHFKMGIHIADTEVPRGVRLIISQRLQKLSESCRHMLSRIAALGQNLDYSLITALADLEEDVLLDTLDEAERASIIRDSSSGRDVRYSFVHEQIRQTLLFELSTPRQQRMHLRIADTMEQMYRSRAEDHAAEIAHHLYQAGAAADGDRTAHYLILAGENARASSAFDEAIQMFDAAETVLQSGDVDTRSRILFRRAMALRGAGQMDEALETFQVLIDLLPSGKDQDHAVIARAELLLGLFRGQEAVHDFERLLAVAEETGDKDLELTSLLGLGKGYYIISLNEPGGGDRALESYEKAYRVARETGNEAGMVRSLAPTHHLVDYWPSFRPRAKANIEEATEIAEKIGDDELILDCAQARLRFLDPGEAHAKAEELLARLQSRRDPLRLKEHYFFMMGHCRWRGELSRCVEICDAGISLAEQLGVPPVQYPTRKALALISLGRFGEAWSALQAEVTEEPFGYAMQQYGVAYYLMGLLAFEQAAGKAHKVVALATKLDRAWMRTQMQNLRISALIRSSAFREDILAEIELDLQSYGGTLNRQSMAEVALVRGSLDEALSLTDLVSTDAERSEGKLGWIAALELKLRILLELDRAPDALAAADRALQQAEQIDCRSMLWRILAGRARARKALGAHRDAGKDHRGAAIIIRELSSTISDAELKLGFETSPLVTAVMDGAEEAAA